MSSSEIPALSSPVQPGEPAACEPERPGSRINIAAISRETWFGRQPGSRPIAAYQVGRLLNCLNWLRVRSISGSVSADSSDEVLRKMRELDVPLPEDEIHAVTARLVAFAHGLATGANRQAIVSAIQRSHHEWLRRQEDPNFTHWVERVHCEPETLKEIDWERPAWNEARVLASFDAVLDQECRDAIELGRRVDQEFRRFSIEVHQWYWDYALVNPDEHHADPTWMGAIEGLAAAIGIPHHEVREILAIGRTSDNSIDVERLDRRVVSAIELHSTRDVVEPIRDPPPGRTDLNAASHDADPGQDGSAVFGLRVDEHRRIVRRDDHSTQVDLSTTAVGWQIFEMMYRVAGRRLTLDEMQLQYRVGEWSARGEAVGDLNRRIAPLAIAVRDRQLIDLRPFRNN